jgi:hypothetical protein
LIFKMLFPFFFGGGCPTYWGHRLDAFSDSRRVFCVLARALSRRCFVASCCCAWGIASIFFLKYVMWLVSLAGWAGKNVPIYGRHMPAHTGLLYIL